jgi:hypothetical protein
VSEIPNDLEILSPSVISKLTPEQLVNWLDQRVAVLQEMIRKSPPPPTNEVTAMEHVSWSNRLKIYYGRCVGALEALSAIGAIGPEQFIYNKGKLMGAILWKTTNVVIKP